MAEPQLRPLGNWLEMQHSAPPTWGLVRDAALGPAHLGAGWRRRTLSDPDLLNLTLCLMTPPGDRGHV